MSKGSLKDCIDFCNLAIHNAVCPPSDIIQVSDPFHVFNFSVRRHVNTDLTSAQQDIIDSYFQNNRIVVNTSRQLGLTSVIESIYLYDAIYNPGRNNVMILPSTNHKRSVFDSMYRKLSVVFSPSLLKKLIVNITKEKIEFVNGSKIETFSVSDGYGDSVFRTSRILYSRDVDNIYIENFTSWEEIAQKEIYHMMPTRPNATIVITSVPWNKYIYWKAPIGTIVTKANKSKHYISPTGEIFEKCYTTFYRICKDKNFDRIKIPGKYNELVDKSSLREHKKHMGKDRFNTEFACKFINNKPMK